MYMYSNIHIFGTQIHINYRFYRRTHRTQDSFLQPSYVVHCYIQHLYNDCFPRSSAQLQMSVVYVLKSGTLWVEFAWGNQDWFTCGLIMSNSSGLVFLTSLVFSSYSVYPGLIRFSRVVNRVTVLSLILGFRQINSSCFQIVSQFLYTISKHCSSMHIHTKIRYIWNLLDLDLILSNVSRNFSLRASVALRSAKSSPSLSLITVTPK